MNSVYIDMREKAEWLRKYFKSDFVSIDDLLNCIENLDGEVYDLKDKIRELSKSEEEKYEEWKWEQADLHNDEVKMGLI